jgi:hypothetical protein
MFIAIISGHAVQVDECDAPLLTAWNWHVMTIPSKHRIYRYVVAWRRVDGKRKIFFLHREIAGPKVGEVVDHINHDTLDNRRVNLRVCTHAQNIANRRKAVTSTTSQYLGVYFSDNRWRAQVTVNGRRTSKRFRTEADAVAWRNQTASLLHGQFANLSASQPALQALS